MSSPTFPNHVRMQGSAMVHFAKPAEPGLTGAQMPCGYFAEQGKYATVPEEPVTCPRCLDHNMTETVSGT